MNWYWGDLHCHTNLSYGRGGMERAFEIARTHLDFCSVTGHAFWHDMPQDLGQYDPAITMHLGGFAKCRKYWRLYQQLTEQYNDDKLVTFGSYEWHSDRYGDYNVYAKSGKLKLTESMSVAEFENLDLGDDIILVPHHIGYTQNNRGLDWEMFNKSNLTAVIEVYSNHGCAIGDESPFDYYHSMGPRDGRRTVEFGLGQGLKFGFIASTDSHDGFPGHYSHGRVGVLAKTKTRDAIWEALIAHRTVAITGAKIETDFQIDDAIIGTQIFSQALNRKLQFALQGNQPFRIMRIIKNGQPIVQTQSNDVLQDDPEGVYYLKLEWGWGKKEQVYEWDNEIRILNGSLLAVEPCFRHTTFDGSADEPPHRITEQNESSVRWISKTRGVPDSFIHNPQTMTSGVNSLILKIHADERTRLEFKSDQLELKTSWPELRGGSVVKHAGGHESPAVRIKRPYAAASCKIKGDFEDQPQADEDYYYLWAMQTDDESVWSSPIWIKR